MTLREAITTIRHMKPSQYDEATLTRWISELDRRLYEDMYCHYENDVMPSPTYDPENDADTELLVAFPHDDIYLKWAWAQIDYHNAEFERYNNAMVVFNAALEALYGAYNRENMPKQDAFVRM